MNRRSKSLIHNNIYEDGQMAIFAWPSWAHEGGHTSQEGHLDTFAYIRRFCVFLSKVATFPEVRACAREKQLPLKLRGTNRQPAICRQCNQTMPASASGQCWTCDAAGEGEICQRGTDGSP